MKTPISGPVSEGQFWYLVFRRRCYRVIASTAHEGENFVSLPPRRRVHLRWVDRALFIWLYWFSEATGIQKPKSVLFCKTASSQLGYAAAPESISFL
jgi:hypothetical protein